MKLARLKILITGYLIGIMFFYSVAVFELPKWAFIYYSWDKLLDGGVFAWAALYDLSKQPIRPVIKPIFLFSVIRFLWEVVSYFTGVSINNEWVVALLFLILLCVIALITFIEFDKHEKHFP